MGLNPDGGGLSAEMITVLCLQITCTSDFPRLQSQVSVARPLIVTCLLDRTRSRVPVCIKTGHKIVVKMNPSRQNNPGRPPLPTSTNCDHRSASIPHMDKSSADRQTGTLTVRRTSVVCLPCHLVQQRYETIGQISPLAREGKKKKKDKEVAGAGRGG